MPYPRYTSDEISSRGQMLYDQQIQARVDADNKGKFLILDIETGDYEMDENEWVALQRAKTKHPDAAFYIVRIGYPTAHKLEGKFGTKSRSWKHRRPEPL